MNRWKYEGKKGVKFIGWLGVRLEDKGEVSEVVGGEVRQILPEQRTCGAMEGHDRVGGEVARDDPPGYVKVEVRGCPGSEAAR